MAYPKAQDEASLGDVGNQRGSLRTNIGVAQVDVSHPSPNLDVLRSRPHQLGRCQGVIIDLGGEDRVEPRVFGLARYHLDLMRTPPCPRNHPKRQLLCHAPSFRTMPYTKPSSPAVSYPDAPAWTLSLFWRPYPRRRGPPLQVVFAHALVGERLETVEVAFDPGEIQHIEPDLLVVAGVVALVQL